MVTVPAGTFRAIVVNTTLDVDGQMILMTSYYVRGVALIKQKVAGIEINLEKFEPAK